MIPLLKPYNYFSPEVFEEEKQKVFQSTWQLVGYRSQLVNVDDWITAEIGGLSIFVQNCGGDLKAFLNSCSHRYSRLRAGANGNGCIQCPYHGWRYNMDGLPTAIPSRPRFDDMCAERIQELRLTQVNVAQYGPFIFVCIKDPRCSLREYLGDFSLKLNDITEGMGSFIGAIELDIKANWKLVIENTLEGYHLPWVHGATFGKLGMSYPSFHQMGDHAFSCFPVNQSATDKFSKINRLFHSRPFISDGYFHTVLFPNFGIGTLYGMTFAVQRFVPVSPNETRLVVDMFGTCLTEDTSVLTQNILTQFFSSSLEFSKTVLMEDKFIVEEQHLGIQTSQRSGILSEEEQRIIHFQRQYLKQMTSII